MRCVLTCILYQPKTVLSIAEITDPVCHVDILKYKIYFVDTVLGFFRVVEVRTIIFIKIRFKQFV